MDIKTLEALGLDAETLGNRIVDQAVDALLYNKGFNTETDSEYTYESRFKQQIEKLIKSVVDKKIAEIADAHIVPKIGEMISDMTFQETNGYGEARGQKRTFLEYLAHRAEFYMSENVNRDGKSKEEAGDYRWSSSGPRLSVLMRLCINEHLEKAARSALTDVNKAIAKNIEDAAKEAIAAAATAIKVSVSAK